ncbi:unnamed protein product [Leptidea sinapis]|uniref:Poly(A) RNA polymerase mitochondrial-like central palm domain-containing protein n=1 Tax=Leptidea sinapis TaxID=189913 RepID=A0A5E4QM87_9NEOP|nr:unnamed protein product [Leptidea sinapis]
MNEGASTLYHSNGFGGSGAYNMGHMQMERQNRQYPYNMLNGGINSSMSPRQGTQRRWQPRRDRRPIKGENTAFGYDSDDSSLSSNASGSNKSSEKGSKWDSLSQDIWDKFVKSQQTEATFHKKMNLWKYLYITIKSSDMDLCLFVRAMSQEPRAHALSNLDFILPYIRAFDPDAELIQAKVPILKFRDARNGVQVDLNCNNVVGIKNTNLLYCLSTSGTSPAILPRASDVMCGHVRAGVRRSHNRASLGELFLSMLRYYADFPCCSNINKSYNEGSQKINEDFTYQPVEPRKESGAGRVGLLNSSSDDTIDRTNQLEPQRASASFAEVAKTGEPFDLSNTARSVYDPDTFEKIVVAFRDSYRRLAAGLRLSDAWPTAR